MTLDSGVSHESSSAQPESNGILKWSNQNASEKGWIIQKFGGTSVGNFVRQIAIDIVRAGLKDNNIIVVCSAKSTGKKAEGTTSRLLEIFGLLEEVRITKQLERASSTEYEKNHLSKQYRRLVDQHERLLELICDEHTIAAQQEIKDEKIRARLIQNIKAECKEIEDYRGVVERYTLELNERSKDRMISFGEKLSCQLVAAVLEDHGVESEYVDLADIVNFKPSKSLDQAFYQKITGLLREKVEACGNKVPVMTGYFGIVPGGLMDGEIGRGYTDLCAALVAVAMKAQELQIWKEVEGIFTADPNKVPTARLLPTITPNEAAELTFYGSEVIHHLTMTQVANATPPIQIRIKNVKNPSGNGTIVLADKKFIHKPLCHSRDNSVGILRRVPKRPTAVTIKDKVSVINVHSNKRSISHNFYAKVFSILDKHRVCVDLISTSEVHVSMAIHSASLCQDNMQLVKTELEACGEVSILNKMVILSLIGADMRNMIGVAGKMFSSLGDNNINIEMISQGASEINISCVIDAYEATRAMNILHTNLFTFLEQ
ncbi:Aspartate kinase [Podosphaera aphanis]|nr:Aspartate kinase [Podosphaera aphanis]